MPGAFTRTDDPGHNRTPADKLLEAWPQIDAHMLARQGALIDGAETTITFEPGLCFSAKAKAGVLDINGQKGSRWLACVVAVPDVRMSAV
jgi:hypothetical protein